MRTLKPSLRLFDGRALKPQAKTADRIYSTPEYQAWRARVINRAGCRCEWTEQGKRCIKAEPQHRMFADHIVELQDGGTPYDPANGRCLCGAHHTLKTATARAARLGAPSSPDQGRGGPKN